MQHDDAHTMSRAPMTDRWVQLVAGLDVLPTLPTADVASMQEGLSTYRTQQRMPHVLERMRDRAMAGAALTYV